MSLLVAMLLGGLLAASAEDAVEGLEGILGPDNEATNVATRGQLKEVQGLDVAEINAGDVAESLADTLVLVEDDEGSVADHMTAVAHLANTGADLAGVL
jgi:hypothetical protein